MNLPMPSKLHLQVLPLRNKKKYIYYLLANFSWISPSWFLSKYLAADVQKFRNIKTVQNIRQQKLTVTVTVFFPADNYERVICRVADMEERIRGEARTTGGLKVGQVDEGGAACTTHLCNRITPPPNLLLSAGSLHLYAKCYAFP